MKKVMIIAGGEWQIPLIKKAKELGLFVVNTNLYENSPGFMHADVGIVADVLDKNRNLEIAMQYQPDAIITDQSDIAVPTVAYISEKMGLNGIGYEKSLLFTNKYKMREFCQRIQYPSPGFSLTYNVEEAVKFLEKYKKIIIKPLDSQASRGVFKIESTEELKELWDISRGYSISEKCVLVEEFVEGTEFTVDGISIDKKHYTLAISQKKHFENYPNVASELFFSHYNSLFNYEQLREQHNYLVNSMGLSFGLTHAEYIFSNGKFYLIEIAARGGGTNISGKIVPFMSQFDSMKMLINLSLGNKAENIPLLTEYSTEKCCVLKFFDMPCGKVKKIKGEEIFKNNPSILDYRINFKVGDTLCNPSDDSKRIGHFIAAADTRDELKKVLQEICLTFQVELE